MKYLTETNIKLINFSMLLLRVVIGLILFVVGAGKVFGWFGGFGLETSLAFYTKMGISVPLAYVSILTEFIGGFLLIVGLFVRPVLIFVIINMLVAIFYSISLGFLMGVALPLMIFINAIVIFLTGPLSYSIDAFIQPGPMIRLPRK